MTTTEQLADLASLASWKYLGALIELAEILCRGENLEAALMPGRGTAFELGFTAGYMEAERVGGKSEAVAPNEGQAP